MSTVTMQELNGSSLNHESTATMLRNECASPQLSLPLGGDCPNQTNIDLNNHYVYLSGFSNMLGQFINQTGIKLASEQMVGTPIAIDGNTETTKTINTINNTTTALQGMMLIDKLQLNTIDKNGDVVTDNSSLQTLLQVPIVQVLTNGDSNPQLDQPDEQIYLLSIKVDDGSDVVNGGTNDTMVITTNHKQVTQFNEPLRTSTPTMIENGMNETILFGNVEESDKKIGKEDNSTNCKISDNATNDEVQEKTSQEDIQNEDKKIDENNTSDSQISNKQISEIFLTEETIPKKKT